MLVTVGFPDEDYKTPLLKACGPADSLTSLISLTPDIYFYFILFAFPCLVKLTLRNKVNTCDFFSHMGGERKCVLVKVKSADCRLLKDRGNMYIKKKNLLRLLIMLTPVVHTVFICTSHQTSSSRSSWKVDLSLWNSFNLSVSTYLICDYLGY